MRMLWHHAFGVVGMFNILLGLADNRPFNFWAGLFCVAAELLLPPRPRTPKE